MSAESVLEDFYTNVYTVLKGASAVTALVPEANIFPSYDSDETPKGNIIEYEWIDSRVITRSGKGEGTFQIRVHSVKNKVEAQGVMSKIRLALTPRALSRITDSKVIVHLFRETRATNDGARDDDGRHVVLANFDVKLVAA